MGSKTYLFTATFRMSGDLPEFIVEDHIKANVISGIEEGLGEVELWGEYYGDNPDHWAIFNEGEVKIIKMKEFAIDYCALPFCEHCGDGHTDFGAQISDGGTHWCFDCYFYNGGDGERFTDEEKNEFLKEEKRLKKEYYINKLKEMGDD